MTTIDLTEFEELIEEEWAEPRILDSELLAEIIERFTISASIDELAAVLKYIYGGKFSIITDDTIAYEYTSKDTLKDKLFG